MGRDQRHERLDGDVRAWQLQRPAIGIPHVQTGGFQQAVLLEQADPVLAPPSSDPDQVLGQIPGVEDHHANGHFVPDGRLHQLDRQGHLGVKRRMPGATLRILEQHGVPLRMETIPRLFVGWPLELRNVCGHRSFPLGSCFIAAIQAQAQGEAHGATDREAGDRVMGQGIGAVAVVVMAVHMVKEASHMVTQRSIDDDERVTS